MSRQVDSNITRLLDGLGLEGKEDKLCDFCIADQNSIAETQGITPTTSSNFQPVLGKTVTYVVACVIINDSNKVLMIQEAKTSCAGTWYLPAGRMEKGETIVQAAAREVLEETGLVCEPNTLLMVETAVGMWYRFVFSARVVGGVLKTPTNADKESLQANWISDFQGIPLRSNDILCLIEKAHLYKRNQPKGAWHSDILPALIQHVKDLMRLIIVISKKSTDKLYVLLSEKFHFPICEINPAKSVHSTLRLFMVKMFGEDVGQYQLLGLLNMEHNPVSDGCCMTLLVALRPPLEKVQLIGKYVWQELSHDVDNKLASLINKKNSTVELMVR